MTKYIGPKTADENVATQADKLSLSSATPDALTPDQAGAAGTATTAARSDHQHEILAGAAGTILPDDAAAEGSSTSFARADHRHAIAAASAGTITGTNAEGTSTSFARADHNHAYGALSIPNSALALGPTYETSLPGSPLDGQEIYYAADGTDSIIWHLRYRSAARSGNGAWEFLGGPRLQAYASGNVSGSRTANTWYSITGNPSLTLPLKGTYAITLSHQQFVTAAGGGRCLMSYKIDSSEAVEADGVRADTANSTMEGRGDQTLHKTFAAASTLEARFRALDSATYNNSKRLIAALPVLVHA